MQAATSLARHDFCLSFQSIYLNVTLSWDVMCQSIHPTNYLTCLSCSGCYIRYNCSSTVLKSRYEELVLWFSIFISCCFYFYYFILHNENFYLWFFLIYLSNYTHQPYSICSSHDRQMWFILSTSSSVAFTAHCSDTLIFFYQYLVWEHCTC